MLVAGVTLGVEVVLELVDSSLGQTEAEGCGEEVFREDELHLVFDGL